METAKKKVDKDQRLIRKVKTMSDEDKLTMLWRSFSNGIRASKAEKPRSFLERLGLDPYRVEVGFNSGQFFHNKPEEVRQEFVKLGILYPNGTNARNPQYPAYSMFGKNSIVFPLLNNQNEVVNFFCLPMNKGRRLGNYLNQSGIYPRPPHRKTRRVILTQTVLDAATLIQSGVLENKDSVMALFDGELLPHQREAIVSLKEIHEVLVINTKVT